MGVGAHPPSGGRDTLRCCSNAFYSFMQQACGVFSETLPKPAPLRYIAGMQRPDLSLFPDSPGVYLYKDASGKILYVGKAARLRRRIASYFRDEARLSPKTVAMLQKAESLDFLSTGTEKEALLLEAGLIKKHRPRYNIVLRDDKDYLLFRISSRHPFPRVEIIRRAGSAERKGGDKIFGPFSSGGAARETWKIIHKHFPLRRCRDAAFTNRTRPCLYYDIGQCQAPCVLPVSQTEYRAALHKVELLLSGRSRDLVEKLRAEMMAASESLAFEQAARLRDQLQAVERTIERQSVVLHKDADLDLIGIGHTPEGLALGHAFVRQGMLLDQQAFFFPGLTNEDVPDLLAGFISQFYLQGRAAPPARIIVPWLPEADDADISTAGAPAGVPAGILAGVAAEVSAEISEAPAAASAPDAPACDASTCGEAAPAKTAPSMPAPDTPAGESTPDGPAATTLRPFAVLEQALSDLRGAPVLIRAPRDADEDNLVLMAAGHALDSAKQRVMPSAGALLAQRLHLAEPVRRIEAVDISHTGGRQVRAGMVVFEDEEPRPEDYRAYQVETPTPGDDYAALAAWAERRIASGPPWPDLVLIDGGKGQLAAVLRVFTAAALEHPPLLAALAKARDEEGHADRRAGNVEDRLFLPNRSNPVPLRPGSPELLFLQRIRDAVHRYTLGKHRKARSKAALTGELVRLPGIGPEMARRLFEHFGSLKAMVEADAEALRVVPGVGRQRAEQLRARLRSLGAGKESGE